MTDDELSLLVSTGLQTFSTSGRISTPLTSMDFLLALISFKSSSSVSPGLPMPRLTDLARVEKILEAFSSNWDHGSIQLSQEGGELHITDVHLGNPRVLDAINPRKRKRAPIDEDADSAAGNTPDEISSSNGENDSSISMNTPLGNLSKDLKEVYAILQKGTAKGRLLAERVCVLLMLMYSIMLNIQH
jgi:mRNA (2'-O-methyladenosine-N6-)-methyltransferase